MPYLSVKSIFIIHDTDLVLNAYETEQIKEIEGLAVVDTFPQREGGVGMCVLRKVH